LWGPWLLLIVGVLAIRAALGALHPHALVAETEYNLAALADRDGSQVLFSEPFQLADGKNVALTLHAPVSNSWLYVDAALIDAASGLVQPFSKSVEYYFGHDSDGNWSEGDAAPRIFLSPVPAGTYTLRLECSWESWSTPTTLSVRVEQGVADSRPL